MAEYEMVRQIMNLCPNNQMRDVFFEEVETDNPEAYVCEFLKGRAVEISCERGQSDSIMVYAICDGLMQQFVFTPI